jgi:hypothetical protein
MVSRFFFSSYSRIAIAAGIFAVAFGLASIGPSSIAAAFFTADNAHAPAFTVNHFRKGDRLPLFHVRPRGGRDLGRREYLRAKQQKKAPLGCDPVVSPVNFAAPVMLYGRCAV